ncbi:unnamed protein product [Ambrosiozyma monospora]|uniref:Unnamed protein product n=1 Tax=Ambrosiozyma monospora TaxID=43982 RepID=A0ACB5U5Z0_AMBMO|nr:unnamed protein product [Ambrosiozyma monospora]
MNRSISAAAAASGLNRTGSAVSVLTRPGVASVGNINKASSPCSGSITTVSKSTSDSSKPFVSQSISYTAPVSKSATSSQPSSSSNPVVAKREPHVSSLTASKSTPSPAPTTTTTTTTSKSSIPTIKSHTLIKKPKYYGSGGLGKPKMPSAAGVGSGFSGIKPISRGISPSTVKCAKATVSKSPVSVASGSASPVAKSQTSPIVSKVVVASPSNSVASNSPASTGDIKSTFSGSPAGPYDVADSQSITAHTLVAAPSKRSDCVIKDHPINSAAKADVADNGPDVDDEFQKMLDSLEKETQPKGSSSTATTGPNNRSASVDLTAQLEQLEAEPSQHIDTEGTNFGSHSISNCMIRMLD